VNEKSSINQNELIDEILLAVKFTPELSRLIQQSIDRLVGQQMLKWNKINEQLNLGKSN